MCWYEIELQPRDILFFRDAKPMEASSVGSGANWPWPNALHDSLISAFHNKWTDPQEWEFTHKHQNKKDKNWDTSSMRFGGLKTVGLFPEFNGEIHFPKPADISKGGDSIAVLCKREGYSNMPSFLEYTAVYEGAKTKESAGEWISSTQMNKYLQGNLPDELISSSDIYDNESRCGIVIDPQTGTTQEGGLYIAEYLRLREGVQLRGFASCTSHIRGKEVVDVCKKFWSDSESSPIVMGGQRGVVMIKNRRDEAPLPFVDNRNNDSVLIKWVLLTPAIFIDGWKPGWVNDDGMVQLVAEKPERKEGESRADWRDRFGRRINAKLVAAIVDKARPFSGWSLGKGGPRATRLAVPSGSVYYFRADSVEDANALVKVLQGHCKSDYFGEKGFGFGLCATWNVNNS